MTIKERIQIQIIIEGNAFVYIYLKSTDNHKRIGKCLSDVRCSLLYDSNENLIGMKLFNARNNSDISLNGIPLTENIKLPTVGYVDAPSHNVTITETENEISIMFDGNSVIRRVKKKYVILTYVKKVYLALS